MASITFVEADGNARTLEARPGFNLMQVAMINRVAGIVAACGGDGCCATCQVRVDPAWLDRLPPATRRENHTLRYAWARQNNSRLACQIAIEDELDGFVVYVPERQY